MNSGFIKKTRSAELFIETHRSPIAEDLREEGRSALARAVLKLPSGAPELVVASSRDLPVARFAYALANTAVAVEAIKEKRWIDAVQAADVALIFFGLPLGQPVLDLILDAYPVAKANHRCSEFLQHWSTPQDLGKSSIADRVPEKHKEKYSECTRVERISVQDFKSKYFNRELPVVLQGAAQNWPAIDIWSRPSNIDSLCGFRVVPVELSTPHSPSPPQEKHVTMQEMLAAMYSETLDGKPNQVMYLAQHPLFDYFPELRKHIDTPKYVEAGGSKDADLVNVWMGSAKSGTRLHYDSADNFLVQVVGWKRIVLFSPDETKNLHCTSSKDNFSPIDVDRPDIKEHPKFLQAKGQLALLGPGDILYIPASHWHWVRAMTASISVNFWF